LEFQSKYNRVASQAQIHPVCEVYALLLQILHASERERERKTKERRKFIGALKSVCCEDAREREVKKGEKILRLSGLCVLGFFVVFGYFVVMCRFVLNVL
jgi:hypothetical protein